MFGSPKSTSLLNTFHVGFIFCFFPADLMSSTYTDKNNPFSRCTNKHSRLETFSQPYFNRFFFFFQIAFPIPVLPKKNHSDFAQEERLCLPYWTMILASLCRGGRLQMSGHCDFGIFNNFGASPFLPGYKQILHQLLVLRTLAVWKRYP